ncbi:MAG TPA: IS3 family transposase [Cyclobacteriaceae bacterium]|nr:IS3 family transposase [Cyclobacteriaceae bacterium]
MIRKDKKLSMRRQCELLELNRSMIYYQPKDESDENLYIMRMLDKRHLDHPTHGVLQMQDFLFTLGLVANVKRIRRLLRLMGVMAHYPKRNLSKLGQAKYVRPYLLRSLEITRTNQVWAIDITYIPMAHGFMYLTAIIDLHSRFVVGWALHNTLEAENCLGVLKDATARYGKPEIINSDQGSQFTCALWTEYLESEQIQISMDGKGRATDNIFIERLWRTVKQDYVYLYPAADGQELYEGIKTFLAFYNHEKTHQGIGRVRPADIYLNAA